MAIQHRLVEMLEPNEGGLTYRAPAGQLLKWVGNKQRHAAAIARYFPSDFERFVEPFLGSGALTATVAPTEGVASDTFKPLMEIWFALKADPMVVVEWYESRYDRMANGDKREVYEELKSAYNSNPNGADLLFLSRTCYGGVVRFRKRDGYMSTPCGPHRPMPPSKFQQRVVEWHGRIRNVSFRHQPYDVTMASATAGDLIYCDPPYSHSQSILYGAQDFRLWHLFEHIARAKERGARVALSIDGTKKSGDVSCRIEPPSGLFEREVFIDCGASMLRRFQVGGRTVTSDRVADRLLLTY